MRPFGFALTCLTLAFAPLASTPARAAPPPRADATPHVDAPPAPAPGKIHQIFDIVRDGDKIGADQIDIDRQNDATTVKTKTNISVKVMYIEAYRYEHSCNETWKNGQLIAFKSETNDNGTKHAVEIAPGPTPDKLSIIVDGKHSDAPKTIAPVSFWSKDVINRPELFDPADGKRLSIKVKDLGEESLTIHGVKHQTHHYKISEKTAGDFERDLWFDGDALVRMKMLGSDHSTIVSDLH